MYFLGSELSSGYRYDVAETGMNVAVLGEANQEDGWHAMMRIGQGCHLAQLMSRARSQLANLSVCRPGASARPPIMHSGSY